MSSWSRRAQFFPPLEGSQYYTSQPKARWYESGMVEFLAYLGKEGAVIAEAPIVFLTALALAGGFVWLALRWQYSVRLAHRDDAIADYKRKLDGASPDEAARRIAELEKRLEDPRLLTPDQEAKLRDALDGAEGDIIISRESSSVEVNGIWKQLRALFHSAGFNIQAYKISDGGEFGEIDPDVEPGLIVVTYTGDTVCETEAMVVAGLEKAGLEFRHLRRTANRLASPPMELRLTDRD